MSSSTWLPTNLPRRRSTRAPPARRRCMENSPPVVEGFMSHCKTGLETAASMRLGASRKSSAFAVGGVSSTIRSYAPCVASS